jgi:hypothetical protein
LQGLLTTSPDSDIQNKDVMTDTMALPGTDYEGGPALRAIAGVNPYSDTFMDGFERFFDSAFDEAAAAGATGPDAVHGGAHRGEFFKADMLEKAALNKTRELTGLQQSQAQTTTAAATAANALEAQRHAQANAAQDQYQKQLLGETAERLNAVEQLAKNRTVSGEMLAMVSNLLGTKVGEVKEDLVGEGVQNSTNHNWGAGVNCCFILTEAINGPLPWFVRRGRDQMCTPQRKVGYARMAARLIPLMRRNRAVMFMVNLVMVKPFLACGQWYYTGKGRGWIVRPICEAWFRIWDKIGK